MPALTLARAAMATRFELVLHGAAPAKLRAAGEEALDEIERLEAQLSLYRPDSELAQINARAARRAVLVEPGLFQLLERAVEFSRATDGAFDITVGPLMRCWGFMRGSGRKPSDEELAAARAVTGMRWVELDRPARTVRFAREGVMLDLGAIGKGHALDCAVRVLKEAGVEHALIHGGTSTVCAIGSAPDGQPWKIAVEPPELQAAGCDLPPITVSLRNTSLSVSAVWGKSFSAEGAQFGHVMDPRTGAPTQTALLAAVTLPSAAESDALSTALLSMGPAGGERVQAFRPAAGTIVVAKEELTGRWRRWMRAVPDGA